MSVKDRGNVKFDKSNQKYRKTKVVLEVIIIECFSECSGSVQLDPNGQIARCRRDITVGLMGLYIVSRYYKDPSKTKKEASPKIVL